MARTRNERKKFRARMAREFRASSEAGRFYVTNEAYKEGLAGVPFSGNPVPYEARLLIGGHNAPTYAVTGRIVDGQVRPLGRHKATKRPIVRDMTHGRHGEALREKCSLNVSDETIGNRRNGERSDRIAEAGR